MGVIRKGCGESQDQTLPHLPPPPPPLRPLSAPFPCEEEAKELFEQAGKVRRQGCKSEAGRETREGVLLSFPLCSLCPHHLREGLVAVAEVEGPRDLAQGPQHRVERLLAHHHHAPLLPPAPQRRVLPLPAEHVAVQVCGLLVLAFAPFLSAIGP